MVVPKRFVYILKSICSPHEYYVGITSDPHARLPDEKKTALVASLGELRECFVRSADGSLANAHQLSQIAWNDE